MYVRRLGNGERGDGRRGGDTVLVMQRFIASSWGNRATERQSDRARGPNRGEPEGDRSPAHCRVPSSLSRLTRVCV